MATWLQALAVAGGAALGALMRWRLGLWLNPLWSSIAVGTLLVNTLGGLLCGALWVWYTQAPQAPLRLLWVTGFLGGLTTFSAFSGESLQLLQQGAWGWALVHTLAHVLGALLCAMLGFGLVALISRGL